MRQFKQKFFRPIMSVQFTNTVDERYNEISKIISKTPFERSIYLSTDNSVFLKMEILQHT
jgi:threonine dehydratase